MRKRNILLIYLGLIAVAMFIDSMLGTLSLFVFATAPTAGTYDDNLQSYRAGLSAKMAEVSWNRAFWSVFMGKIRGAQSPSQPITDKFGMSNLKPTGAPIEVLEDFMSQGGITLDCPVFYPLGGYGQTGREIGTGKGDNPKLGNISVEINTKMKVFNPIDHKMSKYALQKGFMRTKLLDKSYEFLSDWFGRYLAMQPYFGFLLGSSDNLNDVTYGVGVDKRSHMNTYCAGAGGTDRITFSNTVATFEAAVASGLNGLTNVSTDWFSTEVIENAVYNASHYHRIAKTQVGGQKVYIMVISDAQAKQLQQDTKWNDRMLYAIERTLAANPLFNGQIAGMYGGALIVVDDCVPSGYITGDTEFTAARATLGTSSGVCIGTNDAAGVPDYMDTPVDPGERRPAILFGKSALAMGKIDEISFNEELSNFGNYREVAADVTFGIKIADIVDKDGYLGGLSGDKRYENVSSLVYWTYSP